MLVYEGLNSQTNRLMEKSRTLGTKMVFVCYLLLNKTDIHINLIYFDDNFDRPHVNVVTFVSRKQSKKPYFFPQKLSFLLKKVFEMYLLSGVFSLFSQNT